MSRTHVVALLALSIAAICQTAIADEPEHILTKPGDMKWGDAPPALPPGGKMAVLYGDPGKPGLFVIRFRMPAHYTVPAHWHSNDETVTQISGSASFGVGDKFDAKSLKPVPTGSFLIAPAKHNHFVTTKTGGVVQIAANGPFDITYVDPADDPRNKAEAKKK
jgi:hypothetical protein